MNDRTLDDGGAARLRWLSLAMLAWVLSGCDAPQPAGADLFAAPAAQAHADEDAEQYDAMTLRSLNDWVIKLLLMPVEGVTNVLSFGGEVRQYQVNLDPRRLLAHQLTPQDVTATIEANNRNAGGWYMDRGAVTMTSRRLHEPATAGSGASLERIRRAVR